MSGSRIFPGGRILAGKSKNSGRKVEEFWPESRRILAGKSTKDSSMRIAQVSPLLESVPPKAYGGTERIVSYLTEELVNQGHEVTLFASGDSKTRAKLVAPCPRSLRADPNSADAMAQTTVMLEQVFQNIRQFDVVHFHIDWVHFPLCRRQSCPHVTTLHGRLDLGCLPALFREYAEIPVVSISDSQREPLPWLNWQGTVYHGLPMDLYTFRSKPGDYLAFLGRVSPEKGLDRAIEIARRFSMPLKIAAKVDKADQDYFNEKLKPLLDQPGVEFIGEVGGKKKNDFLGNAYALLFPIDWPEPFGLVMIEAMACGTPVISWPRGSVPEVMENGVTGFVVNSIPAAAAALAKVKELDRHGCRAVFEKRFSASRMVQDYVQIYERLAKTPSSNHVSRHAGFHPSPTILKTPLRRAWGASTAIGY
jgi:glycosyltransferase involved in cell wall biosynthesis